MLKIKTKTVLTMIVPKVLKMPKVFQGAKKAKRAKNAKGVKRLQASLMDQCLSSKNKAPLSIKAHGC